MKRAIAIIVSIMLFMAMTLPASAFSSVAVKSLKLDKSTLSMKIGETYKLKVTFTPSNTTQKKLAFSTQNKNVATIDANGKITAVRAGTTVITVLSSTNKKVLAKTTVTVLGKPKKITVVATKCANDSSPADSTDNALVWKKIHDSFMKETNIDLDLQTEFILWQEAMNKLQMKFAANDRLDVFAVAEGWMNMWTSKDLGPFRAINTEIDKYGPNMKKLLNPLLFQMTSKYGKNIALPTDGTDWVYGIQIRKDILDKLGLKMPTTLQEFENMLAAMKKAYPDSIPMTAPLGQIHIAGEFFTGAETAGNGFVVDKKADRLYTWGQTMDYVEYNDMLGRWIKNGWLSKDNAQMQFEDCKRDLITDKSFVYVSDFDFDAINIELQKKNPKAELIPLMNAKTIHGTPAKVRWSNPTVVRYGIYKNAKQESVEAFIKYFDWSLANKNNYHLTKYGIEGKHFAIINGKRLIPEELKTKNYYKSLYGFAHTEKVPGYNLYADTVLSSSLKYYDLLNKAPKETAEGALYAIGDFGGLQTDWVNLWTKYAEKLANFQLGKITRAEAIKEYNDFINSDIWKKVDAEIQRQYQAQKKAMGK